MHNHYINKLLRRCNRKKITCSDDFAKIYLEAKPNEQICPCCSSVTKRIHDYRKQTIKNLPFQLKSYYLVLNKRRHACKCVKCFYETYSFLPKYFQSTSTFQSTSYIESTLHNSQSLKETALQINVSSATVGRILDTVSYSRQ